MKRILFLFLPFLPYLATAQVAKDTVTVLTLADIPAGAIRDTTNFTFVQDNAFAKATFDSLYKYTRVKLLALGAITSAELANALSNETGTGAAVFGTSPTLSGNVIATDSILSNKFVPTSGGTAGGNGMYLPSASTLGFSTAGIERVRVTSIGRVGIGTASPGAPLEVIGAFTVSNVSPDSVAIFRVKGKQTDSEGFRFTQNANTNTVELINHFSGPIIFRVPNASERMRITQLGRVGIGTDAPASLLEVNGTSSFADGTALLPSITNTGDLNTGVWFPAADVVGFSTGGVERMRVKANGQVRFIPLAADPAGAENGDVYYNSSTNKLRVYANGTWVDLH